MINPKQGKIKINQDTEGILEALKERFPDKLPKKVKDIEEVNRLIGNQEVISYLEAYLNTKDN
jgi:hypothetical protein